ncbi:MAG: NAD(P)/FAD-dependent oxidoreductase [Pseudomonadota bacterium]
MGDMIDVAIIGAGLSGIGAACHLKKQCPEHSFTILEGREASGGTWDLFRYPGIRSDSDMYTLGYNFKPWEAGKAIADGPAILKYVRETASEYGIDDHIEYQQRVLAVDWNSHAQCWTLKIQDDAKGSLRELTARFILCCAGYYKYKHGYQPEFPGREQFLGDFVHPQQWPESLDYRNKKVVVIGSGATAVTLVPAMADQASEVVMLQRSPTWVVSRPSSDWIANSLRAILPSRWAYLLTRLKNTLFQHMVYRRSREKPQKLKDMLLKEVKRELGSEAQDQLEHFTPNYNPWDQRLCLVPDSDLFAALKSRKARVVTDEISEILPNGIRLKSGEELSADIIISATGLELEILGGMAVTIDGKDFEFPKSWTYRGLMFSGLPNLLSVFGYINASWTLRADLAAEWLCGLLLHMRARNFASVTPTLEPDMPGMQGRPYIDSFSAGYMQRMMHLFPQQGDRDPWINSQRYLLERKQFRNMDYDEPALCYEPESQAAQLTTDKAA